jgi:membrane-associated protease RseP (regulator of RpoE activity)
MKRLISWLLLTIVVTGAVAAQTTTPEQYQAIARRLGQRLQVGIGDPWIGLLHELNLPSLQGAIVVSVQGGGAGEKAGLRVGDLIMEIEHQTVLSAAAVPQALLNKAPGETVRLTIARQKERIEVLVVLPLIPEIESTRQAEATRLNCISSFCPECRASAAALGDFSAYQCETCQKQNAPAIAACIARVTPGATPAPTPTPTPTPWVVDPASLPKAAPVNPPLVLNRVSLKPETVEPGGRFTLEVSYTAEAVNTVSFSYVISAGGQALLTSRVEELEGGGGQPMLHARNLVAADAPGTYQIRVSLMANGITATREVALTVKRP